MMTRPQWLLVICVVAVVGGGWMGLSRVAGVEEVTAGPMVGRPAPDFTLSTVDGLPVTLSALRGRPVVLNFWATWCPPCRAEMPALQQAYDAHRAGGLVVLAVDQDDRSTPADRIAGFGREFGLTFPLVLDPQFEVAEQYRVDALPTTFFIDPEGIIREIHYGGPMARAYIESQVAAWMESR